jgi:hypothetical protein
MSESDLVLRNSATPFDAYTYGTVQAQNSYNICSFPDNQKVVECYLTLQIQVPAATALGVRVAIGKPQSLFSEYFNYDTLTEAEIARSHKQLTGQDTYISGAAGSILTVECNLTKFLPKPGDANYRNGIFILYIGYDKDPSAYLDFDVLRFLINGSTVMGLL